MMRHTPHTFIGTVVIRLQDPVAEEMAEAVQHEVGTLPGVAFCCVDQAAGVLVVTARDPVERADVLALLDRLGCRVTR